jgi:uncharacterized protein YdaU (DUF1376 family)
MALRDQPYLPLFVDDFANDPKLRECSANATGVYIRLLCYWHKTNIYGKTLLLQKDKQKDSNIENFAIKLSKHLPYSLQEILDGVIELLENDVIQYSSDEFSQKRMVKDNALSEVRKEAGSKGGFAKAKRLPKDIANAEIEIEIENNINGVEKISEKLLAEFNNQFTQIEHLSRLTKTTPEGIKSTFPTFIETLGAKNRMDDPFKEQWDYFVNWYKKELKLKQESEPEKPKAGFKLSDYATTKK